MSVLGPAGIVVILLIALALVLEVQTWRSRRAHPTPALPTTPTEDR